MKKSFFLSASLVLVMILSAFTMSAQAVKWTASSKMTSKTEGVITLTANIDKGWHVYGFNQPEDGPVSTTITLSTTKGVTYKGKMKMSKAPVSMMDDMFGIQVSYWENTVTFTRKFKITRDAKDPTITISVNYMACNDSNCQPPQTETFTLKLK